MYKALIFLLAFGALCVQRSFAEQTFSFALIGDLPYGVAVGERDKETERLIAQLNTDKSLAWVLHIGDIKTGGSQCSDAMLLDRKTRFEKIQVPFILTPGDNEWTDCHRLVAGGYDPLERLEKLRTLFFTDDAAKTARTKLGAVQQSYTQALHQEFIENYSWFKNGVQFLTVHVVGSLNGRAKFSKLAKTTYTERHEQEIERREQAAIDWLAYNFSLAKKNNAKAVVVAIHANPGLDERWEKQTKPAFEFFNGALAKHLESFDRPVLLVHGDSHYARIDSPVLKGKKRHKKFLRLESFGENNNAWIKVSVDPNSANVFSFTFFDQVTP